MFWRSKEIGRAIARVAALAHDTTRFSEAARDVANTLGAGAIGKSRWFFHVPPEKPPELEGKYDGVGDWMELCQAAIFEIWYHLREPALKPLRQVAYGVYDWTQAHATSVLCRLALDGLETESIAVEIAERLSTWRYEQQMRVVEPVAKLATRSTALRRAYEALLANIEADDVMDGIEMVAACHRANPEWGLEHATFVRAVMNGHGVKGRTPFEDGAVVEIPPGMSAPAWLEHLRQNPDPELARRRQLDAAVLLRRMLPNDAEVDAWLGAERDRASDPAVRQYIEAVLNDSTG